MKAVDHLYPYLYPQMAVPIITLSFGLSAVVLHMVADSNVEMLPRKSNDVTETDFDDSQYTRAMKRAKFTKLTQNVVRIANDAIFEATHSKFWLLQPLHFLDGLASTRYKDIGDITHQSIASTDPSDYDQLYDLLKHERLAQRRKLNLIAAAADETPIAATITPSAAPLVEAQETEPESTDEEDFAGTTTGSLLVSLVDIRNQVAKTAKETTLQHPQQQQQHQQDEDDKEADMMLGPMAWAAILGDPSYSIHIHGDDPWVEDDLFYSIFTSPFE